jgi:hypothetical protein
MVRVARGPHTRSHAWDNIASVASISQVMSASFSVFMFAYVASLGNLCYGRLLKSCCSQDPVPLGNCSDLFSEKVRGACAGRWAMNKTSGQVMLAFPNVIADEQVTILIRFNYTLNEGLSGFYRSQYSGAIPGLLCY